MRAQVNGTHLYFDIDGSGLRASPTHLADKPTVFALHGGLGFDHAYLRDGIGPLRDDAQVIYVDMRGQGRSGRPELITCTLEQMADDIAALCELLEIKRAFMLGHSAGGFVAMHVALRHPALVQGLILCGSSPTVKPLPDDGEPAPTLASRGNPEALAVMARLGSGDITQQTMDDFARLVGPLHTAPSHPDVFKRVFGTTTTTLDMIRHFMHSIAPSYDLRAELHRIAAPTLAIVGRHDWVCPPRASRAIARGIPGAQLVEFDDAGHFVFSEEREMFLEVVTGFLNKHASRTS
ncbi:alpha/beta fold hydrolase [Paraburkholderia humisilvae]|uniref:2-hydroxymuconate semialdehyde hydrolase n=1 Tax=Paraburkholderia humisilvae TaxID=627669 RepID=A0A6J5D8H3_9BURK|nr:alpha/beta fold hydrolase [Paraburkholderia humisilvae]CAB3749372.1 2-hydroxymuconate semialdehyde hydrolase [Paraburkholderia humisilvae]